MEEEDGDTTSFRWVRQNLLPVLAGVGSVLVVASAIGHVEFGWQAVLREIGIAMLIVAVATFTIEAARVKTFTRELQKHVRRRLAEIERTATDAIMRGPLPLAYYEHIRRMMLDRYIVRLNWEIRLTLHPNHDRCEVWFDQTFTIHNTSGLTQIYSLNFLEDAVGEYASESRIRYAKARFTDAASDAVDQVAADGGTLGELRGEEISLKRDVTMPAGTALSVSEGSFSAVDLTDIFHIVVDDATSGLRCVVEHPASIGVTCYFPEGPAESSPYEPSTREEHLRPGWKRSTWDYPFPLVPSAAIIGRWFPVSSAGDSITDAFGAATQ